MEALNIENVGVVAAGFGDAALDDESDGTTAAVENAAEDDEGMSTAAAAVVDFPIVARPNGCSSVPEECGASSREDGPAASASCWEEGKTIIGCGCCLWFSAAASSS